LRKFLLALCLLFLTAAQAAEPEPPVVITAERVEGDVNKEIKATGKVVVKYGEAVIEGERGLYNRETGDLKVWGNVVIKEGEVELHCKTLIYNVKTKRAILEDVEGKISPTDRIKAERIVRLSEKEWIAYDGVYTPCQQECPDWSVGAKEFKVLLGESFAGKVVTFRIKEIPILVTPYLSGPIEDRRKSGLLTPRVGYISQDGFIYKQPLYIVLGRSADLTLTYEKRTINGEGGEGQFRYVLGKRNYGEATYYQLNKDESKYWKFNYYHTYEPSEYLYGKIKAEMVSSREYYKSSSNFDTIEQSKVYTKSNISGSKLWSHAILNANAVYLRYLDGSADTIYQKLPSVSFYMLDTPLWKTPFTFNLYSKATYFYRRAGGSAYRVNLYPSLKLTRWLGVFRNTGELTYLYTYYQFGGERELWRFKDSLKINRFYRVGSYGISVNPELTYTYTQKEEQEDYPFYDITDRIKGEQSLRPATEIYFYSRGARLGRLTLSADYLTDLGDWGEGKGDLELSPFSWLLLRESSSFNLRSGSLTFSNTYAQVNLFNATVWSNYYRSPSENITYLKWGFNLPLFTYFKVGYSQRFDLKSSTDRERRYSISVNRGCWNGALSYRWVKNYDNTISYQIMLTINLVKLGSYGYKWAGRTKAK